MNYFLTKIKCKFKSLFSRHNAQRVAQEEKNSTRSGLDVKTVEKHTAEPTGSLTIDKPKNVSGVKWSEEELALFDQGLSDLEICQKTGRSMSAVQTKRRRR